MPCTHINTMIETRRRCTGEAKLDHRKFPDVSSTVNTVDVDHCATTHILQKSVAHCLSFEPLLCIFAGSVARY